MRYKFTNSRYAVSQLGGIKEAIRSKYINFLELRNWNHSGAQWNHHRNLYNIKNMNFIQCVICTKILLTGFASDSRPTLRNAILYSWISVIASSVGLLAIRPPSRNRPNALLNGDDILVQYNVSSWEQRHTWNTTEQRRSLVQLAKSTGLRVAVEALDGGLENCFVEFILQRNGARVF